MVADGELHSVVGSGAHIVITSAIVVWWLMSSRRHCDLIW